MISEDAASSAYADLLAKKEKIRARMAELSSNGNDDVQVLPGTKEVHWDNVMKEMVRVIVVRLPSLVICSDSNPRFAGPIVHTEMVSGRFPEREATTHRQCEEVNQSC